MLYYTQNYSIVRGIVIYNYLLYIYIYIYIYLTYDIYALNIIILPYKAIMNVA